LSSEIAILMNIARASCATTHAKVGKVSRL
jgi:hypothetical protein